MFNLQGGVIFPTQVGPPTDYARKRKILLLAVLVFQGLMTICALVEYFNLITGVVMIIGVLLGVEAWREDMNITYICWFGVASFVGFWLGLVTAFIGFAIKVSTIITKFNIPLSCFCGVVIAWWFYEDYETTHPCNDMFAAAMKSFGLLKTPDFNKVQQAPAGGIAGMVPNFGAPGAFGGMGGMSAMLGGGSWEKNWQQLRPNEQRAAQKLGWQPDEWQAGREQVFEQVPWDRLTRAQQDSLKVFQFDQTAWDKRVSGEQMMGGAMGGAMGGYGAMGGHKSAMDKLPEIRGAKQGDKNVAADPFMTNAV